MKGASDAAESVAEMMRLDRHQAERRKLFLEFGEGDAALLRELRDRLASEPADFVDAFYEHLVGFDETQDLLREPEVLARLKRAQARYFDRLLAGTYDWDYFADRLRVGVTHQRVGLDPQWYLGAYSKYLCGLLPVVWRLMDGDVDRALATFRALVRVISLDMGLAIDTYIHADRQALVDVKEFADNVIASVPTGLLVVCADLKIRLANRCFREIFVPPGEDVVDRPLLDVLSAEGLRAPILEVLAGGETRRRLPFDVVGADGRKHPVRVTIAGIRVAEEEEEEEVLLVVEDLSAERRLKARAHASEQRFREVVESATDGIVLMGPDGLITYFNAAAERMFGYRRDEMLGRLVTLLMPADYRDAHDQGVARYLQNDGSATMGGIRRIKGLRKDGVVFPIECTITACRIDGEVVFTGVLRDVTKQRQAEEALRRSEESFRTVIECSPDAVAVHGGGVLRYVNRAAVAMLGYDRPDDLVGRPVLELAHADDRDLIRSRIERLEQGSGDRLPPHERRFLRRDGSTVVVEVVSVPISFNGEPATVSISRDVSERKELTARMMQMDRMIAVGTLAAGVGHEINNPLTYVMANLGYGLDKLSAMSARLGEASETEEGLTSAESAEVSAVLSEVVEALGEARDGADRVRLIVRDLKSFSRGEQERRGAVPVQRVLESAISMAFNEIRHRARLVKDFAAVPPVSGNEARLGQVFLNLLVNAAHAIPEGRADANQIRVRVWTDGDAVAVEVRDTGEGIAPEHLSRVFDPFFTTKPMGQGTGLGLSICRQIVESMGATIDVDSQPGRGTSFRVRLPVAHDEDAPGRTPVGALSAAAATGRILVVDDERMIGVALKRTLEGSGHEVELATSGKDALDLLEADDAFDVIFCDLMMPEVTGMVLHERLAARAPQLADRMIFMTGGAFTPAARRFLDEVENPRLDKPFDAPNVMALVRSFLK